MNLMNQKNRRYSVPVLLGMSLSMAYSAVVSALPGVPATNETTKTAGYAIEAAKMASLQETYGKLPLSFVQNGGQTDPRVKYYEQGGGHATFFTEDGVYLNLISTTQPAAAAQKSADLTANTPPASKSSLIKLIAQGANKHPAIVAEGMQEGKVNYFVGNDAKQWKRNLKTYDAVVYKDIYSGVDMKFYGNNQQMEYDIVVKAGADPSKVRLAYEGIQGMEIAQDGALKIQLKEGSILQKKPVIYQEINGKHVMVDGKFKLFGTASKKQAAYGFQVAAYDKKYPLVIDPTIVYSTFLGGSGGSVAFSVAVDGSGNAYVTGVAGSADFPLVNAALTTYSTTGFTAFATKFNAAGNGLIYSTFLGGAGGAVSYGIAVDSAGNAYVGGDVTATDFPTTVGAFQMQHKGGYHDGFVAKLDATGGLVYATYLGGTDSDSVSTIAVDAAGNAYVAGNTSSVDFITTPGAFQRTNPGGRRAFVTKLDATGATEVYSTYLGGTVDEYAWNMALDASGNAYVTGGTSSPDFPTKNPIQAELALAGSPPSQVTFVSKLDATGTALLYSTFLGHGGGGTGIAVDAARNIYVTGSGDTPPAFAVQGSPAGPNASGDAFVTKLNAAGDTLVYSTFLGGSNYEYSGAIAVDAAGNAYVTGYTQSADFPIVNPLPLQATLLGRQAGYVTALDASGGWIYSTYLGGSGYDYAWGVAVDTSGNVYVSGQATSADFPTFPNPTYQNTLLGNFSTAFLTKIGSSTYVLTLSTAGTGSGTVTGAGSYSAGQTATVTKTAGAGSTFTSWSGTNATECATGSVVMNANKSCTANFSANIDLIVAALSTTTTSIAPGVTFSAANTVKNQGTASAGASTISFHLSTNAVYGDGDDVVLTASRSVVSLAAGGSSAASTTLTIPSGIAAGSYYLCAMADSGNAVVEGNETNNTFCTAATIQVTRADLIMSAVTPNASSVNAGATLSVNNTAKNQGLLAAGSFTVAYRLSTNTIYGDADDVVIATTRSVSSLAVGASNSATTSLTIPAATPAGTYYVCAKADSANTVAESSEVNNTLCSTTTVTVPKPDLLMTVLSTSATSVNRGSSFSVSNTAKNQGGANAGAFAIKFVLSKNTIIGDADDVVLSPQRSVSGLVVGASSATTTTVTVPSTAPTGVYYVGAIADANGAVSESNETNNTRLTTTTITVK